MSFNTTEEIIEDIKQGKMVIIVDDENRENEGDLVLAAEKATPEQINFLCTYGRGLICTPMEKTRLDFLNIHPMVTDNQDSFNTAFTVSVDAKKGITTGISAHDRAKTIQTLIDDKSKPEDLAQPGHVFPLIAREGGVLTRAGHTEAAVDSAKLAGLKPAGVICEIMNSDGTMARLPELLKFAETHSLKICTIVQLIEFRRKNEKLVEHLINVKLPTTYGEFLMHIYESKIDGKQHIALTYGNIDKEPTLVRMHSECFTGDVLHSVRCDCGFQLEYAMKKIKAYKLQDQGVDTVEANEMLGFEADLREYGTGAQILKDLGLNKIKLMTNNPVKLIGLEGYNLEIVERVPIVTGHCEHNRKYLHTKKTKMGHIF